MKLHTISIIICLTVFQTFFSSLLAKNLKTFDVQVIAIWDTAKDETDGFSHPEGLSVNPSGQLYLVDTGKHRLLKFDISGNLLHETGGFGWSNDQFDHPVGIDATNGLDVFVADHRNERIVRYDKNLHYISVNTSNSELSEYLQFGFPKDVAISSQGELYLLDGENHRILKMDVLGNPQISFGDFDSGEGILRDPQKLRIDPSDNILVSDPGTGRIMKYDMLGNFLYYYKDRELESPSGIAFSNNLIFVSDMATSRIFIFLNDGSLYAKIGPALQGGFLLHQPVDLAFHRNRLYVLDSAENRILVLRWLVQNEDAAD